MKISFSTLGCPRWGWGEITAAARDLAYDGIEIRGVGKDISVPSVPEFGAVELSKTLEKLKALSLSIPCLDSDCLLYKRENIEKTALEVRAYVDLAQKLAAPYVRVFAAPPVPQPMGCGDEELKKAQAPKHSDYAGAPGVTLLLETHGIWANSEKLARLLQEIGSSYVGAIWDVHHPYRFMGEKPEETYGNLKPYIKHVHLKDSVWDGERIRYRMPGHGDLPLKEFVRLLKEGGYDGFYSLEWVKRWDMTLEEPGIALAQFPSYLRSL